MPNYTTPTFTTPIPPLSLSHSLGCATCSKQTILAKLSSNHSLILLHSSMAALTFLVLILAMTGRSSANWCVCKNGINEKELQKTLDYACGAGADCNPIHSSGTCFNPNTVLAHCNYAVNSYFQRKGQAQGSCDFSGTASVVTSDPSTAGCSYPTSASATNTGITPVTTTPASTTTTTTTPSTTTPYSTTTPSNGVLGGIGNGMGPSGIDESDGIRHASTSLFTSSMTLFLSGMMLWWA